jgi:hypothetical protein
MKQLERQEGEDQNDIKSRREALMRIILESQ